MVVLDFFIVNVALPSMQTRLHASGGSIEWVVAGYSLTSAVFLITGGASATATAAGGVRDSGWRCSPSARRPAASRRARPSSSVARLVQGVAAALLMPNVLSLIGVLYDGADRARALAAYGMAMGLAAVSRPADRRALLVRPTPPGWAGARVLPDQRPDRLGGARVWRRVLVPGVAGARPAAGSTSRAPLLATAGLTAIVLPLVEGRAHGWPLWTWLSLAAAPLILGAFAAPAAPAGAARRRAAAGARAVRAPGLQRRAGRASSCSGAGQASFFLVLALYLQQGRGLSAA